MPPPHPPYVFLSDCHLQLSGRRRGGGSDFITPLPFPPLPIKSTLNIDFFRGMSKALLTPRIKIRGGPLPLPQFLGKAINKDSVFVSVLLFDGLPRRFVLSTLQYLQSPPLLSPIARCLNPKPFSLLINASRLISLVVGEKKSVCSALLPSEVLQQTLLAPPPSFFAIFIATCPGGGALHWLPLLLSGRKKTPGGIFFHSNRSWKKMAS